MSSPAALKLPPASYRVLTMLHLRAMGKKVSCNPSVKTLAAEAGVSTRHVQRIVDDLKNAGLVRIDTRPRGGKPDRIKGHTYTLLLPGSEPATAQQAGITPPINRTSKVSHCNPEQSDTQDVSLQSRAIGHFQASNGTFQGEQSDICEKQSDMPYQERVPTTEEEKKNTEGEEKNTPSASVGSSPAVDADGRGRGDHGFASSIGGAPPPPPPESRDFDDDSDEDPAWSWTTTAKSIPRPTYYGGDPGWLDREDDESETSAATDRVVCNACHEQPASHGALCEDCAFECPF